MTVSTPQGWMTPGTPSPPPEQQSRTDTERRRPRVALAVLVVLVSIIFGGAAGAVTGRVFAPDPASPTAEVPVPPDEVLHEMFAKVSASVVDIEGSGTSTSGEPGTYSGTGFVLRSDGLIATSAHLVSETATITVTFANGTTASGSVIGISTTHDLAVVKVPKTGLSPLTFADSDGLEVGDLVVAIGNALALAGGPTMSIGIVSALNRSIPTDHGNLTGLIQTSAGISSGDSGGPLLDPSGNVVGINTAAASGDDETVVENIGFAIPSDVARAVLTDLASG